MSLAQTILLAGILVGFTPGLAVLLRNRRGWLTGAALSLSVTGGAVMALFWKLLAEGPGSEPSDLLVRLFSVFGVLTLMSGAVLSTALGRLQAGNFHHFPRRVIAILGLAGLAAMLVPPASFHLAWGQHGAVFTLDAYGKAYFSYLVLGLIVIGHNVENTYRIARGLGRKQLRLPFLAVFGLIGYLGFIFVAGLISSRIAIDRVVAAMLPVSLACLGTVHLIFRERITDTSATVSRRIVYSSFTAFAASLGLLAVAIASQLATVTGWSPSEVLSFAVAFMAILSLVAAAFSSRLQRRIRRFIDRNLYVNRYDYQSQWLRLTRTLDPSQGEEKLLQSALALLKEVFIAEEVTIALRDDNTGAIRPVLGRGCVRTSLSLDEEGPLGRRLVRDQRALLLDRRVGDFEYLPIYVENQEWLEATASRAVAPLVCGNELLGVVGLTHRDGEMDFNYEDLELLDRITGHLAGVLRGIRLGREMAGRREAELLARLSDLRERPSGTRELVDVNALTRRVLEDLRIRSTSELEVQVDLAAESRVPGDPALLRRALLTLVRNAADAMAGQGILTLSTRDYRGRDNALHFVLTVADTGYGLNADAERQSRLHAQTVYAQQVPSLGMKPLSAQVEWTRADGQKWPNGMDLGLFQTRSIVRAHEGEMEVESNNGAGTSVTLRLKAVQAPAATDATRPKDPPEAPGRQAQHAS